MDAAPLTLAHTHARNAALEHKRNNAVAASEEYDLAAAEFAAAARESTDLEARRLLSLMEAQHKKLGEILRTSHERSQKPLGAGPSRPAAATDTGSVTTTASSETARPPSPENAIQPPRLPRGLRPNARDLSSSIASNLASARGIPSTRQKRPTPISPLVSAQNADGQIAQEETRARTISKQDSSPTTSDPASRPPWAPPIQPEATNTPKEEVDQHAADAPFQQFYSTFESLISKLSAPLAFAGLPLTSSSPTPAPKAAANNAPPVAQASPKTPSRSTPAAPAMDYSQLISRAALRAVSGAPSANNPSESFYVVPTTGGTISYAEIMNRAEREEGRVLRHHSHSRQPSTLSNISEDDFVDAQSTILPATAGGPPSRFARHHRGAGLEAKVDGKTMEELALENQALKHLSDTLSRRLHVFEMSSQTASAAMAQSIRSLHVVGRNSPLMSPENSRGGRASGKGGGGGEADDALAKRITDLEEILRRSDARARKKDDENAKLKETITKYREKWDSLKAGAKARRERERETTRGTGTATKSDEKSQDAAGGTSSDANR
ncbi:uncharacterized protein PV06_01199 [Exophiala oligosperma]|uniref:Uncharacterized protein n=1 Tax=Exophiala oligosperma TaxID=215243 RepID=A0A0D2EL74_9EURO|nr:uncharacterized protein PV06_01199 [Exophiala oligosperma]KIW48629.1 hypothetical protein PV06_01199 [Exophiala oligosperma]